MAEIEKEEQTEQVENTEQTESETTAETTTETTEELTDAQVAAAVLAEADKPPVEAVAEQRVKKQEAEARATAAETQLNTTVATLAGQIATLTKIVGTKAVEDVPAPKSPVELYIEENGPKVPLDGETQLAQEKFNTEQAAAKTAAEQASTQATVTAENEKLLKAAQTTFTADKFGKGMDFDTIVLTGNTYLSAEDKLAISQTPEAVRAEELYNRSLNALVKSPLIKGLITSIAAGTKNNNGSEQQTGETENKETQKAPTQDEVLAEIPEGTSAAVANAMGNL